MSMHLLDPVDLLGVVAVDLWFLADGVAEGQQSERVLVVGQVEDLADFLNAVRDGENGHHDAAEAEFFELEPEVFGGDGAVDVGDALSRDAERDERRAEQAEQQLERVGLRHDGEELHEEVDAEAEEDRHGDLQPEDSREIAPQHQELKDDEDHVDGKRRLAERERRDQAQDIRQARDRRRAQEALDHESDASRLDHDG